VIRLGSCMGEVEYLAVSVAIARFQNRLKTERLLQCRAKQIEKLLKVDCAEKPLTTKISTGRAPQNQSKCIARRLLSREFAPPEGFFSRIIEM
jgi:hypothetical protein